MQKRQIYIILFSLLFLSIVFSIVNTLQINRLKRTAQDNSILINEKEAESIKLNEYFNNVSSLLANNLNLTRTSLGLGSTEYPIKNIFQEDLDLEELTNAENEMFNAVKLLLEVEEKNQRSYILGGFLKKKEFQSFINKTKSELKKIDDLETEIIYDGISYLRITIDSSNKIQIKSEKDSFVAEEKISPELLKYLNSHFKDAFDASVKIKQFETKLNTLNDDSLSLASPLFCSINGNTLSIKNRNNSNTIEANIIAEDGQVFIQLSGNPEKYYSFDTFVKELKSEIKKMDLRKEEQIVFESIKKDFEQRIKEPEFIKYLSELSLKLIETPRQDNDYFYYDLKRIDGNTVGSFSILKKSGNIYLVDADEIPVTSLKSLTNPKKETINNIPIINDVYSNKESLTFLLLGNHEKNTDTMILVHIDNKKNKAFLIGIPRDLYWKGRKINSIYQYYGAKQLEKELTEITGLKVTNHIIIDMYAFIDIVNIIGGIEVTLTEDLIDPTYKIRENGIWSTLNYKKGTYKLSGVEALRVARSRHGSNDFDRSKRQQAIIKAFYKKITDLKITDIDKLYKMIHTIFEYVETDFSLKDVISLYNNYNDVEITGPFVLSFDNILYDTYSNIYMLDKEIEIDSTIDKGAWILLPKDNNWNNIKWYIRKILNGEIK